MQDEFERKIREIADAFSDMSDFSSRELSAKGRRAWVGYFSNFSSKTLINRFVIEPILSVMETGTAVSLSAAVTNAKVSPVDGLEGAKDAILSGNAVVICEGEEGYGVSVFTKNDEGRTAEEPQTETVIRGPHEGFTESGESSAMLLRRRLHTEKLKRRSFSLGAVSRTDVSVMYLDGVAKKETVDEVCRRIEAIRTDAILDSGYVEMYIQDGRSPLYPTVGNSERPDKVAAKLLEGRVAVIVDGSPVVLTAPYLFCEAFQVTEDYSKSTYYATFVRILRFFSFLIALYLPPLFVALFVRHRELVPSYLLELVEKARGSLPFSVLFEVIVIFLLFETVREVGLRMPKAVGAAVGIVGSLILGDSAIEAGIASAPVLIVVALAAVCNFIVPPYMNSNVLYRFFMILVSGVLGLFGFAVAVLLTVSHMSKKTSFGVPYLSPFAPMDLSGERDFLFMAPLYAMRRAPASLTGRLLIRREGKK